MVNEPGRDRCDKHYECDCHSHTESVAKLLRDAKERAKAQELRQDEVVEQSHAQEYSDEVIHSLSPPVA